MLPCYDGTFENIVLGVYKQLVITINVKMAIRAIFIRIIKYFQFALKNLPFSILQDFGGFRERESEFTLKKFKWKN